MPTAIVLRKLKTHCEPESSSVIYELDLGDGEDISVNDFIGKKISLKFTGNIFCIACKRKVNKNFNQGYCYPCFMRLPECDICQIKPELCHFARGSCRDEAWAQQHCFIDHTLYAAFTSTLKIGITRSYQRIHRWIDQGALIALPLARVENRLEVGIIEAHLAQTFKDKTSWQKMLKTFEFDRDAFLQEAEEIKKIVNNCFHRPDPQENFFTFSYPIDSLPPKLSSLTPEKNSEIMGTLLGIKGQYLIFEHGVFNVRRNSGYEVDFS